MSSIRQPCQMAAIAAIMTCALTHGSTARADQDDASVRTGGDRKALEQALYKSMRDPRSETDMAFLRGVPLISPHPECDTESQYLTSLIIQSQRACRAFYTPIVSQVFKKALAAIPEDQRMERKFSGPAGLHVLRRVMPELYDQMAFEGAKRKQLYHRHPHSTPTPIGQRSSAHEVTTGLHVLKMVDSKLRTMTGRRDAIISALRSEGMLWEILDRQPVDLAQCERFIKRAIPFVVHRPEGPFLTCGVAHHQRQKYLMVYDLALIERRVTLASGSGTMTYSEYLAMAEATKGTDPAIVHDPLYWDFSSFFSARNLDCFQLIPAKSEEIVTAIYPTDLDRAKTDAIIREELAKALEKQQAAWNERANEKQKRLDQNKGHSRKKEGGR